MDSNILQKCALGQTFCGMVDTMTEKDFLDKYGQKLNNEQLMAVRTIEGPVLLLAVPGSGKTTVLVNRLGYMLSVKGE